MANRYYCDKTFEEWCVENNRNDILELWDYELNNKLPSEIPYQTKNKYYFKCVNGIHDSDLRRIDTIVNHPNRRIICKVCSYNVDYTGKTIGDLQVIKIDDEKSNGKNRRWICKYPTGEEISIKEHDLKHEIKVKYGERRITKLININQDLSSSKLIRRLRNTGLYFRFRKKVIEKDRNRCVVCGSTDDIEIHHIYPFSSDIEHRFDVSTGVCICKKHHSSNVVNGFHRIYGKHNNTPEQFQDYVNNQRQNLGIQEVFDVYEYIDSCDIKDISTKEELSMLYKDLESDNPTMLIHMN